MLEIKPHVVMPIKFTAPWQVPMAKCAIDSLMLCTPELTIPLTIAFKSLDDSIDDPFIRWIHDTYAENILSKITLIPTNARNVNAETNIAMDHAQSTGATHIVFMSDDVFVRPGWLTALCQCLAQDHCGVATVGTGDLKMKPEPKIREGVYGPFMMYESHRRFDAARFPREFGDTDLILQVYREGLRSLRNHAVVVEHLTHATLGLEYDDNAFRLARDEFIRKNGPDMAHTSIFHHLAGTQP